MADPEATADALVDALSFDRSDEHFAEVFYNAVREPEALKLAAGKLGELYGMTALRAYALEAVRELLYPTWRTRPAASLGDVLKLVDADTKHRAVTVLESAGWDVGDIA